MLKVWWYIKNNCLSDLQTAKYGTRQNLVCARTAWLLQIWCGAVQKWCIVAMTIQHGCWQRRAKSKAICSWSSVEPPTGKNTRFHQELQRNLVIVPKISALLRKSVIYLSALYTLRYSLVRSIAPIIFFWHIDHCTKISAQRLCRVYPAKAI